MASEKTAAAAGKVGVLRRDPMAMLPFCGYHMGDYFAHWLKIGQKQGAKLPAIYYVNWFRKDARGKFLWPGYGENSRVLKWIFQRVTGQVSARQTAIGNLPVEGDLDISGLDITPEALQELFKVDVHGWQADLPLIEEHFAQFGERLPQGLTDELRELEKRLAAAT